MHSTAENVAEKSVEGNWRLMAWWILKDDRISPAEKLKTFRQIRSLSVLPEEATFYLIHWMIYHEYEDRWAQDAEMKRLMDELNVIEDRHHVDTFPPGKGPKKYRAIEKKLATLRVKIASETLREHGEHEMARLHAEDEAKSGSLLQVGRDYFFRVYDPEQTTEAIDRRVEAGRRAFRGVMAGKGA